MFLMSNEAPKKLHPVESWAELPVLDFSRLLQTLYFLKCEAALQNGVD